MAAKFPLALGALSLLGWAAGCVVTTDAKGPTQYESRAVDRDASERVRVNLDMGAGDLKVSSGTQKLLQAYFNYNVPDLKPEIRYSTAGGVGDLQVRQLDVARDVFRCFPACRVDGAVDALDFQCSVERFGENIVVGYSSPTH